MSPHSPRPRTAPRVTPGLLVGAPELAVLALLEESLHVVALALLAAQPALVGEPPSSPVTPELSAAALLIRDATNLERSIARYRRCVLEVLRDETDRDVDLPF